tara:strand:- start:1147 stop:1674 length:528 start_codon:yes stop_codon:yes gene_type:complete
VITRFSNCSGLNTEEDLKNIENSIQRALPVMYREICLQCDYGVPEKYDITYFDNLLDSYNVTCIGTFLSLKPLSTNSCQEKLLENYYTPPEGFEEGLITFAVDPFGNYFCFDYRQDPKTENPPVVFWNHEGAGTEQAVSYLAKDFEAFLDMLKSEEEAEAEYQRLKAEHGNPPEE